MKLLLVTSVVFILNIPFGYWRENVKKFSLQWILSIHLPIPIIIIIRIFSGIGFKFFTYPLLIGAFVIGQLTGAAIYKWRVNKRNLAVSGCLFMDLYHRKKL